jgi:mannose-1-phosphate guanylyltransferase
MMEESLRRISHLIKKDNIHIATNKIYNQRIKKCAAKFNIPIKNILLEPEGKNTFAPISVLSGIINRFDSEAVVVVLPVDHYIKEKKRFLSLLNKAIDVAKSGYIVTLGVPPMRPETGYGYIKTGSRVKINNSEAYKVNKFVEKPDLLRARKFVKNQSYYWNSGIFIFRADIMLNETKRLMPGAYKIIRKINIEDNAALTKLWRRLPSVSVDYAIMEKAFGLTLLPADFGWVDVGSWSAIGDIFKKTKRGNIFKGKHIDMESKNIIVWSDNRLVVTLGLSDIIIVNTKDALLVSSKDKSQDLRKITKILRKNNP